MIWLINRRTLKNTSFNSIRLEVDVQVPVLHLLRVSNQPVEVLDTGDTFWWLLEQTLTDVSHDTLALSNLGWNANKGAELWWEIDVLTFLTNFEQRLMHGSDSHIVSSAEVVNHVGASSFVAVVEDVVLWVHIPLDLMNFVSTMWAVISHNDRTFKLTINEVGVVPHSTLFDKGKAVVDR
jgi:hypothetical protein